MNIFKKTLHLTFLKRVELRVMDKLRELLPEFKKKLKQKLFKGILISFTIALICSPTLLSGFNSQSPFNLINFLALLGYAGLISSILGILFHLADYFKNRVLLFTISKKLSYKNSFYDEYHKHFDVYHATLLNSEELNELLSLSLNEQQVEFLQAQIVKYGHFDLDDLEKLSDMLTAEEVLEKQNNEKQEKLNQFLTAYHLEEHTSSSYMTLAHRHHFQQEKEAQLTSRL